MSTRTFVLNGQQVSVEADDDVRLLWVLRDVLGVTGPKYGCALDVCKACISHINGQAFNPCSVLVKDIQATDKVTTIEGLPVTVGADLHPMQQAWLDNDVAQCGYCQPGQIMAAVALVKLLQGEAPRPWARECARRPPRTACRYPRQRAGRAPHHVLQPWPYCAPSPSHYRTGRLGGVIGQAEAGTRARPAVLPRGHANRSPGNDSHRHSRIRDHWHHRATG